VLVVVILWRTKDEYAKEAAMDIEWAEGVLSARGYRVERLEIKPSRMLFKIGDIFLFPDELHGLAAGAKSARAYGLVGHCDVRVQRTQSCC